MKSIQHKLTVSLAFTSILLSVAAGGALFYSIHRIMLHDFDQSLHTRLGAIRLLANIEYDGKIDFDFSAAALPEFAGASPMAYFDLRRLNGAVVASSKNDVEIAPVSEKHTRPWNLILPGAIPGRAVRLEFVPPPDQDDAAHPVSAGFPKAQPLVLTVARDLRSFQSQTERIGVAIVLATGFFSLATVAATIATVRHGLGSLRGFGHDAYAIDFRSNEARFDADSLPLEIRPIADRLNELLQRVASAFARERRFTADVAHELRTPIAELRSAADIALRAPDDSAIARRAVRQSHEIALQMQTTVTTLLTLVRHDAGQERVQCGDVHLREAIDRAVARHAFEAESRGVQIAVDVLDDCHIRATLPLLDSIVDNLVSNACRYTARGGSFLIAAHAEPSGTVVLFENSNAALQAEDLPHLFEPFWRKDAARADGQHVGLGLSLVKAYCNAIGADIDAALVEDRLQMKLRFNTSEQQTLSPVPFSEEKFEDHSVAIAGRSA